MKRISRGRDLRALIARETLASKDIRAFFRHLREKGCYGAIDCKHFSIQTFDKHYAEISEAAQRWETKRWVKVRGDLKSTYVQVALRQVGVDLEQELGLRTQELEAEIRQREQELETIRSSKKGPRINR